MTISYPEQDSAGDRVAQCDQGWWWGCGVRSPVLLRPAEGSCGQDCSSEQSWGAGPALCHCWVMGTWWHPGNRCKVLSQDCQGPESFLDKSCFFQKMAELLVKQHNGLVQSLCGPDMVGAVHRARGPKLPSALSVPPVPSCLPSQSPGWLPGLLLHHRLLPGKDSRPFCQHCPMPAQPLSPPAVNS